MKVLHIHEVQGKDQNKFLLKTYLKTARRFRIYMAIFVSSIVFLAISSIILSSPSGAKTGLIQNIGVYMFASSIIVFPSSAYALSYRMRFVNTQAREPSNYGDQSFYSVSTDWSRFMVWPILLIGLIMFGLAFISIKLNSTIYVYDAFAMLGLFLISLGLFALYLKFLSR